MIYIINDFISKIDLLKKSVKFIPSLIGTFFTPSYVDKHTFKSSVKSFAQGVMRVDQFPEILLMQPLPFHSAKTCPFWPQCGTFEFFDFTNITSTFPLQSKFKTSFKNKEKESIKINSISCFIYVGFESNLTKQRRSSKDQNPIIGFDLQEQPDIELKIKKKQTLFTTCSASPPTSNGWSNCIFLFPTINVCPDQELCCLVRADYRALIPKFYVRLFLQETVSGKKEMIGSPVEIEFV
jgi:hypothetical protein